MFREPRIDPFQEGLALPFEKLPKLGQGARVDVVTDRRALEPGRGVRGAHEIVARGSGEVGHALAPEEDELLVHALRDVTALERLEPPVGQLTDRLRA